jgi:hypothetical protein
MPRRIASVLALLLSIVLCAAPRPARSGTEDDLELVRPVDNQLSLSRAVQVELRLPADAIAGTLELELDGVPVAAGLTIDGAVAAGEIAAVEAGTHVLRAEGFFRPDGVIENFCDGACDAGIAIEFPFGVPQRCDPFR